MMTNEQHSQFRKKINPIIKACSTTLEDKKSRPNEISEYPGFSSYTSSSVYFFDVATTMKYRDELIDICRELPRLKTVLPGTVCSITSLDLMKETSNPVIMKSQFEAIEKFMFMLNVIQVAAVHPFTAKNNITYTMVDILDTIADQM